MEEWLLILVALAAVLALLLGLLALLDPDEFRRGVVRRWR
jgi:hypothetical protein